MKAVRTIRVRVDDSRPWDEERRVFHAMLPCKCGGSMSCEETSDRRVAPRRSVGAKSPVVME